MKRGDNTSMKGGSIGIQSTPKIDKHFKVVASIQSSLLRLTRFS